MRRPLLTLVAVLSLVTGSTGGQAQMRVAPLDDAKGHVALGLAIRRLTNTGIFMHATAHPDDEDNALLVMLNRGLGFRTALATATRGNGGQNEIGPEIFEALGVLRTEELAAMHRFDGAEQYFTRAVDFGFSFSIEETFEKWGREEITADYVRLIRMIRPDVVLGLRPDGDGGGQHHQASAVIARDAFKAAGDPAKYPEQIKGGLRPWQPKKFYFRGGFGGPAERSASTGKLLSINMAVYDPLLGRTYADIGTEARSMHKCQGMAQLLSLPGPAPSSFELVESTLPGGTDKVEQALFDGIDYSIAGLVRFAGAKPPRELTQGLAALATAVQNTQKAYQTAGGAATVQPLLLGLRTVRQLRAQVRQMPIDEVGRFDIEFRLRQKEREFQQAIVLASSLHVEALADDGVVTPGQDVRVTLMVANRGVADVAIKQVKFDGFAAGDGSCDLTAVTQPAGFMFGRGRGQVPPAGPPISTLKKDQVGRCDPRFTVAPDEKPTEPYWHREGEAGRYTFDPDAPFGQSYRYSPYYVQITLGFGPETEEVFYGQPVLYRYEGNVFSGEKRAELLVVPALSVRVSPEVAIVPVSAVTPPPQSPAPARTTGRGRAAAPARGTPPGTGRAGAPSGRGRGGVPAVAAEPPSAPAGDEREVRVTVVNDTKGKADAVVRLTLPDGWTSAPTEQTIELTREDEARTVRFQVKPPSGAAVGEYAVGATATLAGRSYARGFQVIEYPHIRRQHIYASAAATMRIVDVRMTPNLTVGYIMGVGDEVPTAIAQLGAKVEMISPEDLAWGNLARFNVIVTGVRAYERRADLRASNGRLLDFVRDGGTLIVQYNKFEFNEAQYGPHPAKVTSDRVTDENAPVTIINPSDPLFNSPNKITDAAWRGWVQERGLYFLAPDDSRYREHLSIVDPYPSNPGAKTGSLVSTQYGKGRWVYVGLGLWRELPAGVPGAYQLLANLLSIKG
jgi:LmbE family N-acetylglucosaminyl deacetylase